MNIVSIPEEDIVTIARVIRIVQEDEEDHWEGESGTYALDSRGRVWKLDPTMTAVFQAFDLDEPKQTRKGR